MESQALKPGWKTSEFRLTVANSVVGILVALGYLTPQQGDEFVQAVVAVVGGLMVIVSTTLYLYSRIALKQGANQSSTQDGLLPISDPSYNPLEETPAGDKVVI